VEIVNTIPPSTASHRPIRANAVRQGCGNSPPEEKVTLLSWADIWTMDMVRGRLADLYDCHPQVVVEYFRTVAESSSLPGKSHPLETMVFAALEI